MEQPQLASMRQRKLLRFFGALPPHDVSRGEASGLIDRVMSDDASRERWTRYKWITRDFSRDNDEILPFSEERLLAACVPQNWAGEAHLPAPVDRELALSVVRSGQTFDDPVPPIVFHRRRFMVTGKFVFGGRTKVLRAMSDLGAIAKDWNFVELDLHYLVVGGNGSDQYSEGDVGEKTLAAVFSRAMWGTPAIITEATWFSALSAQRANSQSVVTPSASAIARSVSAPGSRPPCS